AQLSEIAPSLPFASRTFSRDTQLVTDQQRAELPMIKDPQSGTHPAVGPVRIQVPSGSPQVELLAIQLDERSPFGRHFQPHLGGTRGRSDRLFKGIVLHPVEKEAARADEQESGPGRTARRR